MSDMQKASRRPKKPFSPAAMAQARSISFSEDTFKERILVHGIAIDDKDFIENTVTPDRDDAIWVRRSKDGGYLIDITITDIASWIPLKSPIDIEALERGFTEYVDSKPLNPMIPAALSENLFSLNEGEKRPTITATITLNKNLDISSAHCDLYKSYLENVLSLYHGHLTPENTKGDGYDIDQWHVIAKRLYDQRSKPDQEAWSPEDRAGYNGESSQKTHFIVQEFMVLANAQVAQFAHEKGIPIIYRNHSLIRDSKQTLNRINREVSSILNRPVTIQEIKDLVGDIEDRGAYSPDLKFHHGLGIHGYMHFTSPLRRYPDFHSHYNLTHYLDGQPLLYARDNLKKIAQHANKRKLEVEQPHLSNWPYRLAPEQMKYVLKAIRKSLKRPLFKQYKIPKRSNREMYNLLFHLKEAEPFLWMQWKSMALHHLRFRPEKALPLMRHIKAKNPSWQFHYPKHKGKSGHLAQLTLSTPNGDFSAPIAPILEDKAKARVAANYLFIEAYLEGLMIDSKDVLKADYLEAQRHIYGLHYHKPEYYFQKIKEFIPDLKIIHKEIALGRYKAWRTLIRFNNITVDEDDPYRRMTLISDGRNKRDAMTSAITKLFRNHYFQLIYSRHLMEKENPGQAEIKVVAQKLRLNLDLFTAPKAFYEDENFIHPQQGLQHAQQPIRYISAKEL